MTDILSSAISAARAAADEGVDDGAATRLRVRESLTARPRRTRKWTFLAAVIGSLIGSTAFALQAGWQPPWTERPAAVVPSPPEVPSQPVSVVAGHRRAVVAHEPPIEEVIAVLPPEPAPDESPVETPPTRVAVRAPVETPAPRVAVERPRVAAPATAPAPISPPVTVEAASTPPTPRVAVESQRVDPPGTPRVDTPSTSPTPRIADAPRVDSAPAAPAADAELAAYRVAHTAHFRGGDPQAALAAWDAYLARFPDGTLAPEARYDRALVLVKLARWKDARAALAPFASAPAGSYRQREAAQILAAIRDR